MAFNKERYFMISMIICLMFVTATRKRKREKPTITKEECLNIMKIYCNVPDLDYLTAENCAKELIFNWKEGNEVNPGIKQYHDHLLRHITYKINPATNTCSILLPGEFCDDIANKDLVYNESYCKSQLVEFGGIVPSILFHAISRTTILEESNKVYSLLYMKHIQDNITVHELTYTPFRFCDIEDRKELTHKLRSIHT